MYILCIYMCVYIYLYIKEELFLFTSIKRGLMRLKSLPTDNMSG